MDTTKPEVIDALNEMGYGVDPHWETDAIMVFRGEFIKEDLDDIDDYAKSPIAQVFARFRWARIKQHVEQTEKRKRPSKNMIQDAEMCLKHLGYELTPEGVGAAMMSQMSGYNAVKQRRTFLF